MTLPISPISNRWEWPCDMHGDLFRASHPCGFRGGPCSAGWATNFQSPGCWLSMVYQAPLTPWVLPQHRLRDGRYEGSDGRVLCHGLSFPFPVPPKSFSSMQTPNRRHSETWGGGGGVGEVSPHGTQKPFFLDGCSQHLKG